MHAGSYSERVLSWITDCGFAPPAHILDCNSTLTNWQLISCTDMLTVLPAVFFQTPSVGAQTSGLLRFDIDLPDAVLGIRSEEHTSELQSLMRISYAVFCLKKKSTKETQQKQYTL